MKPIRIERIFGIAAAMLVALGCIVVLRPFMSAILLASILCFSTWPLFQRVKRAMPGRNGLAAGLMVLLITLVLVGPFALVSTHLVDNLRIATEWFRDFKKAGLPDPPDWIRGIPLAGDAISSHWQDLAENTEKTVALLKELFVKSESWLLHHSLALIEGIVQLCLSVLISFFFYRDGEAVVAKLVAGVKRIAGDGTQHLIATIGGTVKGVVYGILGTALLQGIVAGIGFWICGIESALLLGFLIFVLSFIPGGPPTVWVPVTVWLFTQGHPGLGTFMIIWGIFIITGVDHVIRPYLISRDTKQSFALILLGILGGILAFGFVGLFIGPTLLAVGRTILQQFISRPALAADEPAGE